MVGKVPITIMIENILKIVVAVIVLIGGFSIGSITSGVEDALWLASDRLIPECDEMEGNWKQSCKNLNTAYYTGKSMFFMIGFFGTILPVYTFLVKNGFFTG